MNFQIPQPNSRTLLAGMTGCGKTTLAREIVKYYPFAVVYDVKGQMKKGDWPGFVVFTELDKLIAATDSRDKLRKLPKVIYQPTIFEIPDEKNWDHCERFFKWVYSRKNICVYIDEVYGCTGPQYIPFYYKGILTRGRERGITCLSSTQRPASIPQFIMSESENFFVFRLQMPQDKKRIQEIKGFSIDAQNDLEKHEFLIATETDVSEKPRILKVK